MAIRGDKIKFKMADGLRNVEGGEEGQDDQARRSRQRVAVYSPEGDWEDEDDDDMDFEPASEQNESSITESESDEIDFHDAEENLSGVEISFSISGEEEEDTEDTGGTGDDDEGEQTETEATQGQPGNVTREQILQLLGQHGLRRLFANHNSLRRRGAADDEEDDELDSGGYGPVAPRRTRGRERKPFPKVPSDVGRELMESGTFGANDRQEGTYIRKKKLAHRLMRRELSIGNSGRQKSFNRLISQGMIPSSTADTIINYDARCYSGQFSNDGNFFFSCAQDFKVHMYDTSNPYAWKYYKTVVYPYGQWTITDASLSPDNKFLAYSSIRSVVCMSPTDPGENTEPYHLDFSDLASEGRRGNRRGFPPFGIWSIRFSGDGREIVAGTSDRSVFVYDLETRKSILRIQGHDDDVNAVCYGDTSSPHILYSGSDDTTLKVWDRRSMGDGRAAGCFLGHTEGLTYIDSKGDGRYALSNAKDQNMKLWDLRKMMSMDKVDRIRVDQYTTGFDYRFAAYDDDDWQPHPHDTSLVTFRGHKVLKTLIRCHFSPPGSTDSRYVYTGSHDGSVYIYNMDATLAGKIDVLKATRNTRPREGLYPDDYDPLGRGGGRWETIVRDCSWHPNAPVIAATSWNGYNHENGTCTTHVWNDGMEDDEATPAMAARVDSQLRHDPLLYEAPPRPHYPRTRARRGMGGLAAVLGDG
ncbi:hypothetical protein LTR04_004576 [Oleoguttula sp. CCFEE 6159]|nr:hypothetical protein LTR04_004576 [Oleoguttula sp. CCFEE 6159]